MPPYSYRSFAAGRAWVAHPAVFIRRDAFGRVGMFDETLKYAMDVDLWLRLGQVARPATIDRALTIFRDHAGSVSSTNKMKARQEEFAVRRRYMQRAPLAFGIYCLRYLKRMRALRAEVQHC
jgi:GT2 family glycosyltransferase